MKKKKGNSIKNWQKIGLGVLIVGTLAYVKFAYFPPAEVESPTEKTVVEEPQEVKPIKTYINVFFIAQNDNNEEVYRAVKREYSRDTDGSQLKVAIENLLKGPTKKEREKGVYTEIPPGTKLLSLEESPDKVIINLSGDFENGGGTEGIYKRLFQLIKTANKNANASVYLYINGKQVDVVGGEGLMITQPLNEKSLDE